MSWRAVMHDGGMLPTNKGSWQLTLSKRFPHALDFLEISEGFLISEIRKFPVDQR